jgi:hypothetical protein
MHQVSFLYTDVQGLDGIQMAANSIIWRFFVNSVMNIQFL